MDDQGIKPSADEIQNQLDKQEAEMGEVNRDDQEYDDVDSLNSQVTGEDTDLPADMPLGIHIHEHKEEDLEDN